MRNANRNPRHGLIVGASLEATALTLAEVLG
jgi:hypothetical protein